MMLDIDFARKVREIVSYNCRLRSDGWAEMSRVGAMLRQNDINIRTKGYKLKEYFEEFSAEYELSVDGETKLPLVKVRQNMMGKELVKMPTTIRKRDIVHLANWASINLKLAIESLRSLALPERWAYKIENEKYPNPILAKYLRWTFVKLFREDKVLTTSDYAAFNTGLVGKFYKPIIAVFDRNNVPNRQPWHFVGFCFAGEGTPAGRILTDNFADLPQRASYLNCFEDVMYDYTLPVDVNWEHIIFANIDRLPSSLIEQTCSTAFGVKDKDALSEEERKEYLSELKCFLNRNTGYLSQICSLLQTAVEGAKARVEWNYKTAIPVYYPTDDRVHLILPLSLNMNNPDEVSLALVMTMTQAKRYRAVTIFTLDMAYSNARLITRPSTDWLVAEHIMPVNFSTQSDKNEDDEIDVNIYE